MEFVEIISAKTQKKYVIDSFKSYIVEQSVDIPADMFNFVVSNNRNQVSTKISAGDEINFYVDDAKVLNGIIDDMEVNGSTKGTEVDIVGRDKTSILLDNDGDPTTLYRLTLNQYLEKRIKKYGFTKFDVSDNTAIDKIVVDPGNTEWSIIDRICKSKGLYPRYDIDVLRCTKLRSDKNVDYILSNDIVGSIKFKSFKVSTSADVRNQVVVYSSRYSRGDHEYVSETIKGSAKDTTLKINKKMIINESELESTSEAEKLAKEEMKKINRNAFSIIVETHTSKPIFTNKIARVVIKEIELDCLMLVSKVKYTKDNSSGSVTRIELKLIEDVQVIWGNHNIPLIKR